MDAKNLISDTQRAIDSLFKEISVLKKNLAVELENILQTEGIEAFGDNYYPEYYGIATIGVGEESQYYIPKNHLDKFPDSYYQPGTWISSSETC